MDLLSAGFLFLKNILFLGATRIYSSIAEQRTNTRLVFSLLILRVGMKSNELKGRPNLSNKAKPFSKSINTISEIKQLQRKLKLDCRHGFLEADFYPINTQSTTYKNIYIVIILNNTVLKNNYRQINNDEVFKNVNHLMQHEVIKNETKH